MSNQTWRRIIRVVILHITEPLVLMLEGEKGWSLPIIRSAGEELRQPGPYNVSDRQLIRIRLAVREDWGIDTIVLRCARMDVDHQAKQVEFIYVLEQCGALVLTVGRWVGISGLSELRLAIADHRQTIETCLLEDAGGEVPNQRPPWERRGWFSLAEAWITKHVERLDYILIAPIEQIRIWGISTILVAHTNKGDLYFKAIPPVVGKRSKSHRGALPFGGPLLFCNEPALTQALAALYPNYFAAPFAIDRERAWMLLPDFGQTRLWSAEIPVWEDTVSNYGKLQVASTSHVRELLAAGCLDRNLVILARQIDPLLNDPEVLSQLSMNEIEQLRERAPKLKGWCSELGQYRVPLSLVHGDLHASNIAVRGENYLFFDWTDACVAHPFFDLVTLLRDAEEHFADTATANIQLRDAYLAQWIAYEPMQALIEVHKLARVLGALHQAISYQHIVANLEAASKYEQREGLRFWLRMLVNSASNA
jgi:hypothetical protein